MPSERKPAGSARQSSAARSIQASGRQSMKSPAIAKPGASGRAATPSRSSGGAKSGANPMYLVAAVGIGVAGIGLIVLQMILTAKPAPQADAGSTAWQRSAGPAANSTPAQPRANPNRQSPTLLEGDRRNPSDNPPPENANNPLAGRQDFGTETLTDEESIGNPTAVAELLLGRQRDRQGSVREFRYAGQKAFDGIQMLYYSMTVVDALTGQTSKIVREYAFVAVEDENGQPTSQMRLNRVRERPPGTPEFAEFGNK